MMLPAFDRYLDVEEMDGVVRELCAAHPDLCHLQTIGRTYENREILAVTVTDPATGSHDEKPAYYVDGNMHATEIAGSMAALHCLVHLVTGFGTDERVTRLLGRSTFYIVPRANPDGAALFFRVGVDVRSGTRPYPHEDRADGLHEEDVDGDGRILTMRIRDDGGAWKVSDADPRLMVRRDPLDEGGTYYRLLPEGVIQGFDGHTIRMGRPLRSIDFNRNFAAGWAPDIVQRGAGPFPISEPETRALADFIAARRNICGAVSYHTTGGVYFRPSSLRPDSELPADDVAVYRWLDTHTRRLTGYRTASTHHEFSSSSRSVLHGGYLDWMYEDLGILSYSPELWDYPGAAGCERADEDGALQGWYYDHPVDHDLAILRWSDSRPEGSCFVPWYAFEHPQLGPVELGGWDGQFQLYNPPPDLLLAEVTKVTDFVLLQAALAPRLEIRHLAATPAGDDRHRVVLVVDNLGFLPTSGTRQAVLRGAVRPVRAEIEGAEPLDGPRGRDLGHLEGRSNKLKLSHSSESDNRARCEWLVRAPAGAELTVVVRSERAGTLRRVLTLDTPA